MKRKIGFLIFNAAAPILLGALLYHLISPDVIFVQQIDAFLGRGVHVPLIDPDGVFSRFVRNYLLDMLWGYALMCALWFFVADSTADLTKVFAAAVVFSAVTELLQLTPLVKGTFDMWDILAETLSEAAAVYIIKKHF